MNICICRDEINNVEFLPGFSLHYSLIHDFRDSKIMLGDYIKLGHLQPGQTLFITDGNSTETLFVGNCTSYIQPTNNNGGIGWDLKKANSWRVVAVYGVQLNCGSYNGNIIESL